MFGTAGEAYAGANAAPEARGAATKVIGSNREDGVVRHLTASWPQGEDALVSRLPCGSRP
ncbi:HAD hydrolase family protein [Nocardioides sp. NBC_00368]|uniref:HAD hydrolase family protein n=1 Tax=Nocardioides sp. NBC_00368 TaxID=2976000 RepID=UPI003FA567BE